MPRIARAVAVMFPHHIIQRGNNREKVFFDNEDREKYLALLKKYSAKWQCPVLAYCLMGNHVHLLARPKLGESLHKMMQGLTLCYTQYVNRKYEKSGRLWESRYHSCIVDRDHYLWAAARYIEQNPRRAKIVKRDEGYPYSSAKAHIAGRRDDILGEELFEEAQRKDYIIFYEGKHYGRGAARLKVCHENWQTLWQGGVYKENGKDTEQKVYTTKTGQTKRAKRLNRGCVPNYS